MIISQLFRSWKKNISTSFRMLGAGNRLKDEKSPYLQQHANNPVQWYPFGNEAIQKAKVENKLIFLSIGYATCHWCHVMEKESFMNDEIAEIMNANFVNIKVDREERPDIDKIYMTFLLMVNQSGGWPLSVWLTPDLAPITAGTYFPPESRWGVPGFKTVLLQIADKWKNRRDELASTGLTIIQKIQESVDESKNTEEEDLTIESKFNNALRLFKFTTDKEWGGFNRAPKFPEVSKLNFMLHATSVLSRNSQSDHAAMIMELLEKTLTKMAGGGICDHIFGGFSRYSVDRKWHVPHFEKMLYDQAQLLKIYGDAFKVTRNQFYLEVCEKIYQYVCSDLIHADGGGFYSGEDADSYPPGQNNTEKIEGAFYAWTYNEIKELFAQESGEFPSMADPRAFKVFTHHFDIQEDGNVTAGNDPHGHFTGKNILFVKGSVEATSKEFGDNAEEIIESGCRLLYNRRKMRPRPLLDTKLICSWNGLMLSGLSKLASIQQSPEKQELCLEKATNLKEFLRTHFYDHELKTLRRSCYAEKGSLTETPTVVAGFLDDYAFLIRGLLDFYVVSMDADALRWAKDLQTSQNRLFWDEKLGGYYYSQAMSPNVVLRLKEDHDGAEPCGNSVSLTNLLMLSAYFEDKELKSKARKCLDYFKSLSNFGYAMPEMMTGALLLEHGLDMLVVVGPDGESSKELLDVARNAYAPGLVIFHLRIEEPDSNLTRASVKSFKMINNAATAYLCHNKVCQLPITSHKLLADALGSSSRLSHSQ